MRSSFWKFGLAILFAGAFRTTALFAEEATKALPTLLIKGEVVSLDTSDPAATLLKVKDRYGFETPIFLSSETKVMQGDATVALSGLTTGSKVEVEYNFDVNTAKRHAVSVKLAASTPAEAAPAAPAEPVAASAPAAPATPAPAAPETPAAPAAPATTPQ